MHSLIDIPCAITFLSCLVLVWSTPLGLSPTGDVSVSPILEYNRYLGSGSCMLAYINTTYNTSDGMIHSDNTESGKYGETNVGSAYGVLIHVRSVSTGEPTACTSPLTTYSTPDGRLPVSEPWIALIKRGQCEFSLKVMNAVQSNASAVLVYNDKDTNVLDTMRIQSVFWKTSAVLTYKKTGEDLADLVDGNVRVMTYISVGNPCLKESTNINRRRPFLPNPLWFAPHPENVYKDNKSSEVPADDLIGSGTSVLFVSVSFIVLMIISLAWLAFYYVQRFRYVHAKDRLSRRLCSAAKKALSKIPTKNIKSEDKEIRDGECCAVCIEHYKISDVLRILPCRHEFHKSCIDPWLLEHRTCPMCKMDILKHYGFVFTGSQESILHLDIEDVGTLGSGVNNDTDRLQRRNLRTVSQIQPMEHQTSSSASSEVRSRSSRASSPDELTPTLCSDQCYVGVTSQPVESPRLTDTSTQHSTAAAGAHHKLETYNKKFMLGISIPELENPASNNCCTARKSDCGPKHTPSCDVEDCELESHEGSSESLSAVPSLEKTEHISKAATEE